MKKKYFLLYILISFLFFSSALTGCSSNDSENKLADDGGDETELTFSPIELPPLQKGLATGRIYNDIATNPQIIEDFKNLGVQWIRIEFEEYIDLSVGTSTTSSEVQNNIAKFKNVIKQAHDNGIKVLGIVGYNSLSDKEVPDTLDKVKKYTDAVEWHLTTYDIDAVEIWNEPAGFGFSPKEKLKWYGLMLIDVYDNLKSKYPDILFVGPATANAEAGEWLGRHDWQQPNNYEGENSIFNSTEMRQWRSKNNGKLPLDVISWHTYGSGRATPSGEFYFGRNFRTYYDEILAYKDLDNRSIIGSYPIWVTEFGWTSNDKSGTGVSEAVQNSNFNSIMSEFIRLPQVQNVFLYDYRDDEDGVGSEGNAHGLRKNSKNNYAKKPIYYSYMAQANGVGMRKENDAYIPVEAISKKYDNLGGFDVLGLPVYTEKDNYTKGYISSLMDGIEIQIFQKGDKTTAITNIRINNTANFIPNEFLNYYYNNVVKVMKPLGDPQTISGILTQSFEGGKLEWKDNKVVFTKKIN